MKELIVKDDTKPGKLAKVIALSPERKFLVKCIGARSDIVLLKANCIIIRHYYTYYDLDIKPVNYHLYSVIKKDNPMYTEMDELLRTIRKEK